MTSADARPAVRKQGLLARFLSRLGLGLGLALAAGASCAEGFEPLSEAPVIQALTVQVVRFGTVRVSWPAASESSVSSYVVERRTAIAGPFVRVAQLEQSDLDSLVWIDTDVAPETVYGYRVRTVTNVGDRSAPSVVAGTVTPPTPGIEVTTVSVVTVAQALDPDGYMVVIRGPDSLRTAIGVESTKRFSPLQLGTYTVSLEGLITRCSVSPATVTADVTDSTPNTIVPAKFEIRCSDPSRGEIRAALDLTGADLDPSVTVEVLGEAADASLPPSERVYSSQQMLTPSSPSARFTNLRPGSYDVTLSGLAENCTLTGTPTRSLTVLAAAEAAATFAVHCDRPTAPVDPTKPFIVRNRFLPPAAPTSTTVLMSSELDLTARATWNVVGIQADYFYDPTVLRYDSTNVARLAQLTVNGTTPGKISVLAASTALRTGAVKLLEHAFTVIGASGATSASNTLNFKASARIDNITTAFGDSVRIEEDTFTVGAGAGVNAPPTAEAGGPYTGVAGTAIALSSAGSTDSDGTITSYAWSFGDGTTGTGATVNKTYNAAGAYTVTLTVTDNSGATATDQATVTVTAGSNTAPIAEANGPYTATVGVPFTLSSVGSSDAGGSIASYSWNLGNGTTATGASPVVTYPTAGTYTITLTVTDNGGLTATDQAQVTVSAGTSPSGNVTFSSSFGAYDATNRWVLLTLAINLSNNLTETPGAEAVRTFVIDSLKWDPAKLELVSVNTGPGVAASVNQTQTASGKISLAGSIADANQTGDAFGVLTFVTLRLRPIGTAGATATTSTHLGPIMGPASTSFFVYNPKITIAEGSFTLP